MNKKYTYKPTSSVKYGKGGKLLKRPDQYLRNKPLKDLKKKSNNNGGRLLWYI